MPNESKPMRAHEGNIATLSEKEAENARNMSGERETIETLAVVAFDQEQRDDRYTQGIAEAVDARFYMGRSPSASVVYCSVWIRTRDGRHLSGRGSASGYGYHKQSAALDDALRSAGVSLAVPIHGAGESAMRQALIAVARAAGYDGMPMRVI